MDSKQNFLEAALAVGLECKIIQPDDVLRHLTPDVLAEHLPTESKTKLLAASLKAGKMNADLVFECVEVRAFAEHMPKTLLWACVAEAAKKALEDKAGAGTPPRTPVVNKPTSPVRATTESTRRRPNLSRRPARLSRQKNKLTTEFEVDTDVGGRWANAATRDSELASTDDKDLKEWVDETAVSDEASRRKR